MFFDDPTAARIFFVGKNALGGKAFAPSPKSWTFESGKMTSSRRRFLAVLRASEQLITKLMVMKSEKTVRELLLEQLQGRNAHVDFNQAVQGLTYKQSGILVEGLPHTIWDLIEHIRIGQDDILEFSKNPNYEEIDWPADYWPESSQPDSKETFKQSIQAVRDGIEEMRDLIEDPENNLQAPLPHGDGQTLFREAMLIVDHNAYHIGQIIQIRRLLGSW